MAQLEGEWWEQYADRRRRMLREAVGEEG